MYEVAPGNVYFSPTVGDQLIVETVSSKGVSVRTIGEEGTRSHFVKPDFLQRHLQQYDYILAGEMGRESLA